MYQFMEQCLFTKDALDNDADASERIWDPLIRHIFAQPWAQRNKLMDHIFLFADGQSARIWTRMTWFAVRRSS